MEQSAVHVVRASSINDF